MPYKTRDIRTRRVNITVLFQVTSSFAQTTKWRHLIVSSKANPVQLLRQDKGTMLKILGP